MTSGEKIKIELGLENFPYVKISRLVGTNQRILFVWYDSYRSSRPLLYRTIKSWPFVAAPIFGNTILDGKPEKGLMTPPMTIQDYNGNIQGAVIIAVDLAGRRFVNFNNDLTKVIESTKNRPNISFHIINEGYTVADLRQNGIDAHTAGFYSDRQRRGLHPPILMAVSWNDKNWRAVGKDKYTSTLTLAYKVAPTFGASRGNTTKTGGNQVKTFYTVKIQFQGINEWIESREAFLNDLTPAEQLEFMKGIIAGAEVKVHSDDMSWLYQSGWENGSKLDYALYPFPERIPSQRGIWLQRKTGDSTPPNFIITKHIMEVLDAVLDGANEIVAAIIQKYGG